MGENVMRLRLVDAGVAARYESGASGVESAAHVAQGRHVVPHNRAHRRSGQSADVNGDHCIRFTETLDERKRWLTASPGREEGAMLDGVDAGLKGAPNPGRGVTVRSHRQSVTVGLIDDDPQ